MNENNIFLQEEQTNVSRPPGHGNNCHGHQTSIASGGSGHWYGDSCGCDSQPSASIGEWIPFLILVALAIIFNRNKFKND